VLKFFVEMGTVNALEEDRQGPHKYTWVPQWERRHSFLNLEEGRIQPT